MPVKVFAPLAVTLALAATAAAQAPAAGAGGSADGRRAETPNGALSLAVPAGWTARALRSGLALEPPGNPLDETIVAACEPFALSSVADEPKLEDLLARLRAGQLATLEESPRPARERVAVGTATAVVVTYRGLDDGGRPAALRIAVLPSDGRAGILTARLPAKRLEERAAALSAILASFAFAPAEEARALAEFLVGGLWTSEAAPGVDLRFMKNGTFEERKSGVAPEGYERGGTFDVIGREVRLRYDEGKPHAFRVDEVRRAEGPATGGSRADRFVSAGQVWQRWSEKY